MYSKYFKVDGRSDVVLVATVGNAASTAEFIDNRGGVIAPGADFGALDGIPGAPAGAHANFRLEYRAPKGPWKSYPW